LRFFAKCLHQSSRKKISLFCLALNRRHLLLLSLHPNKRPPLASHTASATALMLMAPVEMHHANLVYHATLKEDGIAPFAIGEMAMSLPM
jgi:hypothetical protein